MTAQNQYWLRPTLLDNRPTVLIDLDGVLCDFHKRLVEFENRGLKGSKLWTHPDLYKDLDFIPGAKEAWDELQLSYNTYILSTPPWSSPAAWMEKRIWVEKYLGKSATKKLILCHNKGIITGDYLIDDRIAHGVADFKGKHIHFGTPEFPDWMSVLKFLNAQIYK